MRDLDLQGAFAVRCGKTAFRQFAWEAAQTARSCLFEMRLPNAPNR
jgi:hypothetical protein